MFLTSILACLLLLNSTFGAEIGKTNGLKALLKTKEVDTTPVKSLECVEGKICENESFVCEKGACEVVCSGERACLGLEITVKQGSVANLHCVRGTTNTCDEIKVENYGDFTLNCKSLKYCHTGTYTSYSGSQLTFINTDSHFYDGSKVILYQSAKFNGQENENINIEYPDGIVPYETSTSNRRSLIANASCNGCTNTCGYSECDFDTFTCEGGTCYLYCTTSYSCRYMTINVNNGATLYLYCQGGTDPCEYINLYVRGNLYYSCTYSYDCDYGTYHVYNNGYLEFQSSYSNYRYSDLYLYGGASYYISSTYYLDIFYGGLGNNGTWDCDTSNECDYIDMVCDEPECEISCEGYYSCYEANITIAAGSDATLYCSYSTYSYTCYGMEIQVYGNLTYDCSYSHCDYNDIKVYSGGHLTMKNTDNGYYYGTDIKVYGGSVNVGDDPYGIDVVYYSYFVNGDEYDECYGCTLTCDGNSTTCSENDIRCMDSVCYIYCNADESCDSMSLTVASGATVMLYCEKGLTDACNSMSLDVYGKMFVNCYNTDNCQDSEYTIYSNGYLNLYNSEEGYYSGSTVNHYQGAEYDIYDDQYDITFSYLGKESSSTSSSSSSNKDDGLNAGTIITIIFSIIMCMMVVYWMYCCNKDKFKKPQQEGNQVKKPKKKVPPVESTPGTQPGTQPGQQSAVPMVPVIQCTPLYKDPVPQQPVQHLQPVPVQPVQPSPSPNPSAPLSPMQPVQPQAPPMQQMQPMPHIPNVQPVNNYENMYNNNYVNNNMNNNMINNNMNNNNMAPQPYAPEIDIPPMDGLDQDNPDYIPGYHNPKTTNQGPGPGVPLTTDEGGNAPVPFS